MGEKQDKLQNELQTISQDNNQNRPFTCTTIEIVLPKSFTNDKHIDDCLVYKTNFHHITYNQNILLNVTGEFLLLYTCENNAQCKKRFPFTASFLCDFLPYDIRIPSPANIDFSGQEIKICQTIYVFKPEI